MNLKPVSSAILASVGIVAMGQVTKSGAGYQFRTHYVKGQKITYSIKSSMGIVGAQPQSTSLSFKLTVLGVDPKGNASIQAEFGDIPGMKGPMKPMQFVLSPTGKVVSGMSAMGNMGQLPSKAVKVGESWTADAALGGQMGGGSVKAKYTFKGLKSVHGKQVAEISYSFTGANMAKGMMASMSGSGVTQVLVSDGTSFGSTSDITMALSNQGAAQSGGPRKMSIHSVMSRG